MFQELKMMTKRINAHTHMMRIGVNLSVIMHGVDCERDKLANWQQVSVGVIESLLACLGPARTDWVSM